MKQSTIKQINEHLEKARKKHPVFSCVLTETVSIATEELGEFAQAINDYNATGKNKNLQKAQSEALDLIAVLIRFIERD